MPAFSFYEIDPRPELAFPSGTLVLPPESKNEFLLMSYKEENGLFTFEGIPITAMQLDNLVREATNDKIENQCLIAKYDPSLNFLNTITEDCTVQHTIICRKVLQPTTYCADRAGKPVEDIATFQWLLDRNYKFQRKLVVAQKKAQIQDMTRRLDQTHAFKSIFSALWYASLPCFNVQGITANFADVGTLLKYCEWKGMTVPCSSIFTPFPTDIGMCCTFNMKAAEDIFQKNTYVDLLQEMQSYTKNSSMTSSSVPSKYIRDNEPKTAPGRNKGLNILIDTQSYLISPGSINSDFHGFLGLIGPSSTFPFISQEGFEILPGNQNIVTITTVKADADEGLLSLDKNDRNCLFPEENSIMKIHRNYSYTNCMYECSFFYAQQQVFQKYNFTCQPWYFPSADDTTSICDPWQSYDFYNFMTGDIPSDVCSDCLPDCSSMTYDPTVTTIPFEKCDFGNLGLTRFCSFNSRTYSPMSTKASEDITDEYPKIWNAPEYIRTLKNSYRFKTLSLVTGANPDTFPPTYNPFETDIAWVQILYKKNTILQLGSQLTMTWIDYLSTVGGLLGLVLGMGIISFVELVWLALRMVFRKLNLTNWIP